MNKLQDYIILHDLSETDVMNRLQDQGVISDLAVRAEDVADKDCDRALLWLRTHYRK